MRLQIQQRLREPPIQTNDEIASFTASQGIYGAPRVFLDLREAGETCSKHRVAWLMCEAKLLALHDRGPSRRAGLKVKD